MPELPEVETLRRGLAASIVGQRMTSAELIRQKIYSGLPGFTMNDVVGTTVQAARRRAKYLILDLSNDLSLVIHLSLAGQIVVQLPAGDQVTGGHPVPAYGKPLPHKQTQLILTFDNGSTLFLTDIRQFAHVWIVPTADIGRVIPEDRLGIEPTGPEFTEAKLCERLRRRPGARMKPLLLDQSVLAGLGNIYVDESLWAARIHPERTAGSLSDGEIHQLYEAIREVLDLALTRGVARILNGKAVVGAELPRIHGRERTPCPHCGEPIIKTRVVGRGTYLCPRCQTESAWLDPNREPVE